MSLRGRLCSLALLVATAVAPAPAMAQSFPVPDPVLASLWAHGMDSSRAAELAQALLDSVGPRLTASPGHRAGNEWLVSTYAKWGVTATNVPYGTWRSWRRGVTHLDLVQPRVRSLEAQMLAWSAGTKGTAEGKVVVLPDVADGEAFRRWLPAAKNAFVLVSFAEPTCRPDANLKEYATPETYEAMTKARSEGLAAWNARVQRTGLSGDLLYAALAEAGARGVLTSRWSQGWGVNKIFGTRATKAPVLDVSCEDYGLLFRLAERNQGPVVRLHAEAEVLGEAPVFNTIAEIPGTEKPDEYVMLSAHFDSWDGGSGATDNGTGTITMLEAARLLTLAYPKPKRTILIGHWGGEEQGLNGSRAWAADHPEVVAHMQALFNQDNGTGRIQSISLQGLIGAVPNFTSWFAQLPTELTDGVRLQIPGLPQSGGTDNAAFVCFGAPAFNLGSLDWEYGRYTWHTNRDTYDKIVFDEIRGNATLTAMLAYLASEDDTFTGRERRVLPLSRRTGEQMTWPSCGNAARTSAESRR